MQENYLAKWLNNELSEEEISIFKESREYASYKRIVDAIDGSVGPDFDMAKAKQDLDARKQGNPIKTISLDPFKKYLRIAAMLAMVIGISYFYYHTTGGQTVTTQYAERTEVTLPDDSEVHLNAGSRISYNKKKWEQNRNIALQGEAFFKVAKGKRFTVSTNMGTVTVLGTQFNVENRKDYFEVACYEGSVQVLYDQKETRLSAGKSLTVFDGQLTTSDIQRGGKPSWLMDESDFKSIPLKYVLDEFQRQFNLGIKTKDMDLDQLFTGSFSNIDRNLALQSITVPSGIKFKIEGNEVLFYTKEP